MEVASINFSRKKYQHLSRNLLESTKKQKTEQIWVECHLKRDANTEINMDSFILAHKLINYDNADTQLTDLSKLDLIYC